MSKIGVALKIDVTKIEKARLYQGNKGTYLDATVFIDMDNPGPYGDHGMITQDVTKEERQAGTKGPILGNCKVFFRDDQPQQAPQASATTGGGSIDDDVPFLPYMHREF